MSIRKLKVVSLLLGITAFALLGWTWAIFARPVLELANRPLLQNQKTAAVVEPTAAFLSPDPFDQAISRPLFEPNRSPFVSEPTPATPANDIPVVEEITEPELPPPEPPPLVPLQFDLILKGIFSSSVSDKALIVSPDMPKGKWYGTGEMIGQWKIVRIKKSAVEFDGGAGNARALQLYVDNQ